MKTSRIVSTGLAMFAMLFGAGNVVYPLALGRDIGHQVWFGLLGFVLTAVIVPLIGLVSTMLADGDYKLFLGKESAQYYCPDDDVWKPYNDKIMEREVLSDEDHDFIYNVVFSYWR